MRRSSGGIGAVGAAQQNIGLDADRAQLLDRVLGRFCLEFAGAWDERQKRQVNIDRMPPRHFVAELADGLEIRQALDVADRAADLAEHEIVPVVAVADEVLDGVGDVRNDLDGGAEIVAAALLGDDVLVDPAGGDGVLLRRRTPREALVVPEIEIGLGAVVGDEHLAMLIGRHRAGIDIEIGVELAQADLVAARLQQRAERRRSETFAEGGHHAAGDENVPRHGT